MAYDENVVDLKNLSYLCTVSTVVTFNLPCQVPSRYCVLFRDGSHQYILIFELIVIFSSIAGVLGYYKASKLHQAEKAQMVEILNPSVEHELDSSHD